MRPHIPFTFEALDQALNRCVVTRWIDSAAKKCPPDVQSEKVEAVSFTVCAHVVDLAAQDHRLDLRSVAADLTGKTDGKRNIIQAH